ncbi:MAG TPA: DinB family protein [Acidimicrobiales bacterium]|nr:DinB family protein [Acidimicrobiales bacterium]
MTSTSELLVDGFGRVHETVHAVMAGLPVDAVTFRPGPEANPIGWLVWHLTRVQDDHVAGVAGTEQRWTAEGWDARFALPFDRLETGYGQDAADAGTVVAEPALLLGYHDAVHSTTLAYARGLSDTDLDRVVDTRWDPPVTLGVRLVSVLADDLEHVGQAAYVRGLFEHRGG